LPPEVFGKPTIPNSSSTSRTTPATTRTRSNPASGIGSRSIRHSSGRSTSARRTFHGWNSTVDICTAQMTDPSSVTHSSSAVRFQRGKCSRTVCNHGGAPVRDPLLVDLLAGQPLGEPVQHARPLAQRPDDAVADREVVVRQVEFGPPVLREIHPVGVAEPDRPLTDSELDRGCRCLRGHHRTLSGMPRPRHTVA
jgi:hypothetical protein